MFDKLKEVKLIIGIIMAIISLLSVISGFGYYVIDTHNKVEQNTQYLMSLTEKVLPLVDEDAQIELMRKAFIAAGGG